MLVGLVNILQKQSIHAALRTNETGMIYSIIYVDHQTKCVFIGSDLGKRYSVKDFLERCLAKGASQHTLTSHSAAQELMIMHKFVADVPQSLTQNINPQASSNFNVNESLLNVLMPPERTSD